MAVWAVCLFSVLTRPSYLKKMEFLLFPFFNWCFTPTPTPRFPAWAYQAQSFGFLPLWTVPCLTPLPVLFSVFPQTGQSRHPTSSGLGSSIFPQLVLCSRDTYYRVISVWASLDLFTFLQKHMDENPCSAITARSPLIRFHYDCFAFFLSFIPVHWKYTDFITLKEWTICFF